MEDIGAEVAINAQWSGGASLLRCIDQKAKEMREQHAGQLVGKEQELRTQVTACLAAQDRLASQPQI